MRVLARASAPFSLVFIGRKKTPQETLNWFNKVCPLIARADKFDFPAFGPGEGGAPDPLAIYYGVNISVYKEPLEQFDPLLLARSYNQMLAALAPADKKPERVKLTIFVAGKYRLLNIKPDRDPFALCAQWMSQERQKEQIFKKAAAGLGMEEDARVLKTDDLWGDGRYWEMLASLIERREQMPNTREFKRVSVKFGDLPKALLGAIGDKERQQMANECACEVYLYAELAEAQFLRQIEGVSVKIGPQSEEEYDRYLRPELTIVQLKMPLGLDSRPGEEKLLNPYIGQKEQVRIWDKDIEQGGGKANIEAKLAGVQDYGGGPLDQYRARLGLLGNTPAVDGIADLAESIYDYAVQVFGTDRGG